MAVVIEGVYEGSLNCTARHGPSGAEVRTTAPADNGGTGTLFSPTDLFSASLGACMMTIGGLWAKKNDIKLERGRYRIEKHMTTTPPRRVARLVVAIEAPSTIPADKRASFEAAVLACPVKLSLHPDIELDVRFTYPG